jgi:hypothetical protein
VVIGHAGAGHDGRDPSDQRGQGGGVGRLDELDPHRVGQVPSRVGRAVIDDERAFAVGDEGAQHGAAGHAEAQHEVIRQSRPPVPMKSA